MGTEGLRFELLELYASSKFLVFDYQSGGHGEMGRFYRANLPWILMFSGWGVATGIGLRRAWRGARISTLIVSGILAAGDLLVIAALLRVPADQSAKRTHSLRSKTDGLQFQPAPPGKQQDREQHDQHRRRYWLRS
ncbi:MAG TPA: hypothetical protein VIX37_21310 [Candidatus Sulfotelmatobacter sp.]